MGDFPNVAAWHDLTDATVAAAPDLGQQLGHALATLGVAATERDELLASLAGRRDPAAAVLNRVAVQAGPSTEPPTSSTRPTDAEMDEAIAVVDEFRREPVNAASVARVASALPPDRAGEFAVELLGVCPADGSDQDRLAALEAFVSQTKDLQTTRMPVVRLAQLGLAVERGLPSDHAGVADLLARVPTASLLAGLARAIGEGSDPAAIVTLLERVARLRHQTLVQPPAQQQQQQQQQQPAPAPPSRGGVIGRIVKRWRSAPAPGGGQHAEPPAAAPPDVPPTAGEGGAEASHPAYPRIDVSTGTARDDVVVVEQEFSVTVGLRQRQDHTLIGTVAIAVAAGETIDVVLVFDPESLATTAPTRQTLTVTADDPYPSVVIPFVAKYLDAQVPVERRIGVHYVRQGQVVGLAWRTFVAVDEPGQVPSAPAVATSEGRLINLSPLLDETPPDLVIGICSSDNPDGTRLVWTVYPAVGGGAALDGPRTAPMDDTAAGFAKALRFKIQFGSDPDALFQDLAGAGAVLGRIVPASVRTVIRAVVEDPARTTAATILLLTEELHLPWELATFQPPLASHFGGAAPFLGAHAAIGRWPLSEGDPRPVPRPRVEVAKAAVLSAKYDGVTKWGKLDQAEAEAAEVTTLFGAESVLPTIRAVADLFAGTPTVQLVHVALHGQFDTEGAAEGLVLLAVDAAGAQTAKATFFSPLAAENGHLAAGPFIFLNACQVGADRSVLGDYGGFASTLLRIGAAGVVAPLWNVDDDVAAAMAREFYAATWSAAPADRVSVAEAMRRARARYTLDGVSQRTPGVSPTLIAFQCLAHPQLRLTTA
ncbi:hypothetical protein JNB_14118 [Janibacter sp. HTCC2649]|uniref:CHAT domain-containing protein n=1 Tax=Janibacter sp. HTCC2649 TaxID=313589 RepID=UPI000067190D|nr:CHAT domain-containing protein [Janibacter sp. HTCC2649]EAP98106.1 hypothetical protein JNB_14118 [Janibacter sp. HTCC2649]